jgi:hypothetical protein
MFEPALGMRDTPRMSQLLDDWNHFGKWMKGEWVPPHPESQSLDYELIEDPEGLRRYVHLYQRGFAERVAVDTEKHGAKPWSMQFSICPGTGRMVRAEGMVEECVLEQFDWWLKENDVEVVLHNAPQDLDTLDQMGIRPARYRDTMQEAYQTNFLPQGLKALAYRLFGVTMRSWEDVVWPASVTALLEWISRAIPVAQDHLSESEITTLVRGRCGVCNHQHATGPCRRKACGCTAGPEQRIFAYSRRKAGAVESILRHVARYTAGTQDQDTPYDPWKAMVRMREEGLRGRKAEEWEWDCLTEELGLGPAPILGIGNCEEHEAMMYAIGDADFTGRVAARLEEGRGDPKYLVAKEDWDK